MTQKQLTYDLKTIKKRLFDNTTSPLLSLKTIFIKKEGNFMSTYSF